MKPVRRERAFGPHLLFAAVSALLAAAFLTAPMVAHAVSTPSAGLPGESAAAEGEFGNVTEEEAAQGPPEAVGHVPDPLEPMNRFFFKVNDKLYFWMLKPVATGYKKAIPEGFRVLFANLYHNISAPVRIFNDLFQGRVGDGGREFARLVINSTVGVGGLRDCAGECFGVRTPDADFGQTLGFYGLGQGFYIVWPVLGPSTARESVGFGVDWLFYPSTWFTSYLVSAGLWTHKTVNNLSFHPGEYEALKKASIDPYIALRNAYIQNRAAFVAAAKKEKQETGEEPKKEAP